MLERELAADGDRIVIGVSGGPDSMALAHVLARLAGERCWSLVIASVDHGLRAEAAAEVATVGRFAEGLQVPFYPVRLELERGPGVQARARRARYEALRDVAGRERAQRIAVGHTQDDQAETVLARLLRGTGVAGLAAIEPQRADGVIRPLIDCRREAVRAYVSRQGLVPVDDPSNADEQFLRVRLRRRLIPALLAEDPQFVEHCASLADDARVLHGWLAEQARAMLGEAQTEAQEPPTMLDRSRLQSVPQPVRRRLLAAWLAEHRPGRAQLEGLDRLVQGGRGSVLLGAGWAVSVREPHLVLHRSTGLRVRGRRLGERG